MPEAFAEPLGGRADVRKRSDVTVRHLWTKVNDNVYDALLSSEDLKRLSGWVHEKLQSSEKVFVGHR